ncbi:MAG: Ig-like domain-containing protein [Clostridia bacterium]|nr:Ig-like domain-containing protein [Clostridia bacterium]
MADKKSFSKKIQTVIVSLAVVAVAAGSVAYGIHFVMKNEGIYEIEEYTQSNTYVIPFGKEKAADWQLLLQYDHENVCTVCEYMNTVTGKLSDPNTAKVNIKRKLSVPDSSVVCGDDAFARDFKAASGNICGNILKTYFPDSKGKFGEASAQALPAFNLKNRDIKYAVVADAMQTEDEFSALLPAGFSVVSDDEYNQAADKTKLVKKSDVDAFLKKFEDDADRECYHVLISVPGGSLDEIMNGRVSDTFGIAMDYGIFQLIKNDIMAETGIDASVTCNELKIEAEINRLNDNIKSITYSGNYTVKADLNFFGKLEKYGEKQISFDVDSSVSYDAVFAGLQLSEQVLYIEKGDEKEIPCEFNTEDDAENTVYTWESENPELVSVTENGYVTGEEYTDTPVKLFGHAEYLGKSYDVVCLVYVIKPVKNITLNEKELSLKTGETHQLTYVLDPEDATIKDAYWFTTDDNVVSVDDNGVVTAVGAGSACVIAVSKNENFKSTCTVTVE